MAKIGRNKFSACCAQTYRQSLVHTLERSWRGNRSCRRKCAILAQRPIKAEKAERTELAGRVLPRSPQAGLIGCKSQPGHGPRDSRHRTLATGHWIRDTEQWTLARLSGRVGHAWGMRLERQNCTETVDGMWLAIKGGKEAPN